MISAQRSIDVRSSADEVWRFVEKIGNWASQMPGYVSHEELGRDDSIWTLNVQMGPFSRSIVIEVKVLQWRLNEAVDFTLTAPYEPFHGTGSFFLYPRHNETAIKLELQAEVTGSMSKILTGMAAPVLEKIADEFSINLQLALNGAPTAYSVERQESAGVSEDDNTSPGLGIVCWWKSLRHLLKRCRF
jgi:carbon monoxide dehydrogenase subunit G